jgi:hypothetical protein
MATASSAYRAVIVAGLGPSQAPSATRPIYRKRVSVNERCDGTSAPHKSMQLELELSLGWRKDGTIEVTGTTKFFDTVDKQLGNDLRGRHAIVFP